MKPKRFQNILIPIFFVFVFAMGISIVGFVSFNFLPQEPVSSGYFPSAYEWVFQASDEIISTPATDGSNLFIRTCCSLISLDPSSAKINWQVDSVSPSINYSDEISVSPKIFGNKLIVPTHGGAIAAYSISSGNLLWETQQIQINIEMPGVASVETFKVGNGKVFVARKDWKLSTYDADDGKLLWETRIPNKALVDLAIDQQAVFMSVGRVIRSYDQNTGELLWEKEFNGLTGPILMDGRTIYIVLSNDQTVLTAVDLDTLKERWTISHDEIMDRDLLRIALADGRLYVAGNRLTSISSDTGSILWSSKEMGQLETPIVNDVFIFIRNKGKDLFMLDSNSGNQLGSLRIRGNYTALRSPERGPLLLKSSLFVPFGDNRLFAYRTEN